MGRCTKCNIPPPPLLLRICSECSESAPNAPNPLRTLRICHSFSSAKWAKRSVFDYQLISRLSFPNSCLGTPVRETPVSLLHDAIATSGGGSGTPRLQMKSPNYG